MLSSSFLFVCFLFFLIDSVWIPSNVNYTPCFAGILSERNVHLIWMEILFRHEDKAKICVVGANYVCFHPLFYIALVNTAFSWGELMLISSAKPIVDPSKLRESSW